MTLAPVSSFDSLISTNRSLPSRVRSPTPANTDTPPWALATLLMSSMMSDGLADAGAAEEADLAAAAVGSEQVDDLDARLEDLDLRALIDELGGLAVDGRQGRGLDWPGLVDGFADDVEDATERRVADRHPDGPARVEHLEPAHEAIGRVHGDGSDARLAEVLRDLEHEIVLVVAQARIGHREGVQDLGQRPAGNSTSTTGPIT